MNQREIPVLKLKRYFVDLLTKNKHQQMGLNSETDQADSSERHRTAQCQTKQPKNIRFDVLSARTHTS